MSAGAFLFLQLIGITSISAALVGLKRTPGTFGTQTDPSLF
jgi:hypothetical protein